MAKRKLQFMSMALAALLITSDIKAQSWFGQMGFNHNIGIHSSATVAPLTNRFIECSFSLQRVNATAPDFSIDCINQLNPVGGGSPVSWEYQLSGQCVLPGATQPNCIGISIVEYRNAAGMPQYAIAGETADGIFFATINPNTGLPIRTCSWRRQNPNIEGLKATIKKSRFYQDYFYILAPDGNVFHVICVDVGGNQIWAKTYDGLSEARDIIESPYSAFSGVPEVIVVGKTINPNTGTDDDGFFMSINADTASANPGSVNYVNYYDNNNISPAEDNWFNCIDSASASSSSGAGFVLGGNTFNNNTGNTQWVGKFDPMGVPYWSNLINPQATPVSRDIARIYERQNPNSNQFEYYCVAGGNFDLSGNPSQNLTVYKLDENGDITLFPAGTFTEFHYSGYNSSGLLGTYADITGLESGIPTPGGINDGIQVYGTATVTPNKNAIIKAYFNGVTAPCTGDTGFIQSCPPYPLTITSMGLPDTDFHSCNPNNCGDFCLSRKTGVSFTTCIQPSVAGGDNSRMADVTTVNELEMMNSELKMYPNPVKDIVTLNVPASANEHGEVAIYNAVGALVKTISFNGKEAQELSIDFNTLQVESGFYMIRVKAGNTTKTFKAIYNPEENF